MDEQQIILKLIDKLNKEYRENIQYKNYYDGEHKILSEKINVDPTRSDQRVVINFCRTSVDNHVGYCLGKPITLKSISEDDTLIKRYKEEISNFEHTHDTGIDTDAKIYGKAYEVRYVQDGKFRLVYFSPLEMAVQTDGSFEERIVRAIRKYKQEFDDAVYLDVWDDTYFSKYKLNHHHLELIERVPHTFSRCPVSKLKRTVDESSLIKPIIPVQDSFNRIATDAVNEIRDNRMTYLLVSGVKLDEADRDMLLQRNIINDPEGGEIDAKYIYRDLQGQFVNSQLEFYRKRIYELTHQIDFSENPPSNTSSVAIVARQQNLENLTAIYVSQWIKLMYERLMFFCEYLKIKDGIEYNPFSVEVKFNRNIPTDNLMIAQIIKMLFGIAPTRELLALYPEWDNPDYLMNQLSKEKETNDLYAETPFDTLTSGGNLNGEEGQ